MMDIEDLKKLIETVKEQEKNLNPETNEKINKLIDITHNIFPDITTKKLAVIKLINKEIAIEILNSYYTASLLCLCDSEVDEAINHLNKIKEKISSIDRIINK